MTRLFFALLVFSVVSAQGQSTPDDDGLESLTRLAGQALVHPRASLYLEELADGIGPRVTGSPAEVKALDPIRDQSQHRSTRATSGRGVPLGVRS